LALIALLQEKSQRDIILIVEFSFLINTKILQAFALGISPRLLAFVRLIAIYRSWSALIIAVSVILLLVPLVEPLASLNLRKGSCTGKILRLATTKCLNLLSGRGVGLKQFRSIFCC
jgi:hypothetical protein